jgi:acyl-homoserine lactone acylase PvdQ
MSTPATPTSDTILALPKPRRRWPKRLLLTASFFALLLLVAVLTTSISLRRAMHTSLPQLDGDIHIAGLTAPVNVTRDAQGVPSIRASNLDDLLFAQGYITAQDRLWQMDALRRHGAGDLAEILGPSALVHDRRQRTLQLRAAADRALAILPADQLQQLNAYAHGVNAFITTHPSTLPVEFHLLRYTPEPWTARDSLLISLVISEDLATDFPQKMNRESLSQHLPAELVADLYPTGSWRDHPPSQQPVDLTAPTDSVEQIPLDRTQSLATPQDLLHTFDALHATRCDGCRSGSNNWAVAGTHTVSGAPLVSNDMHLSLSAPDIWYEAALHASGSTPLDVEGFTLPGVPYVIVGRNASVAWSVTNLGADVQDLRIEHLRGTGTNTEFELPDHTWQHAAHHHELIHVRFAHDVDLDVLTTTHTLGAATIETPVITALYPSERRALSLSWPVYDPTTVNLPLLSINTAPDAASLVAAFANFSTVALNLVYADAHTIGYHTIGRVPVRGPAVQHPRPATQFIMPDRVPEEDEEDESGSLKYPSDTRIPQSVDARDARVPQHLDARDARVPQRFNARDARIPQHFDTRNARVPQGFDARDARIPQRFDPRDARVPQHLDARDARIPQHFDARDARVPQGFSLGFHRAAYPMGLQPRRYAFLAAAQLPTQLPAQSTLDYTIGNPISPLPTDALDASQDWSGYVPYDALPSVINPPSGVLATANSRITPDNYPYYLATDWADPYRVERIYKVLTGRNALTPADMLRLQTDVHSDFDLYLAQRLAYAIDETLAHSTAFARNAKQLHQAADLLRDWNGDVTPDSAAASLISAERTALWPMLLMPQLKRQNPKLKSSLKLLVRLYTWDERTSALESLLQHTPSRWLPPGVPNWNTLLTTALADGLAASHAPADLRTWRFGSQNHVEIAHPLFGSDGLVSKMLGVPTGTGEQSIGGENTTVQAIGPHFGPSERFTADLSSTDAATANLTTGESGDPASPFYLDQFPSWLHGTTFPFPLNHPQTTHTLTLLPQ